MYLKIFKINSKLFYDIKKKLFLPRINIDNIITF